MQVYQATEVLLETYPVDPKLHDIIVKNVNPPDFGDDEWNSRQKYQMSPWDSSYIKEFKDIATSKGFLLVSSSPLTRSSYHADEDFKKLREARLNKIECRQPQ